MPNYRLSDAHRAVQVLHPLTPLSFGSGLAASFLTLWDAERGRLVSFREAMVRASARAASGAATGEAQRLDPLAGKV